MRVSSVPCLLIANALVAATGCGGGKAPAPDASAPEVAVVDAAPPPPPSRLEDAKALMGKPLDPTALEGAVALADALAAEPSRDAKVAAARIRLAVVARDMAALVGKPQGELRLGVEGARGQLDKALAAAGEAGMDADAAQTMARVKLAGTALQHLLDAKPAPDVKALRALERDPSAEAAAYRLALLATVARHRELGEGGMQGALATTVGPLVCTGCGAAIVPAEVAAKAAADGAGLSCAAPDDASWCAGLLALQAKEPAAKIAENAQVIAGLELVAALTIDDAMLGEAGKALLVAAEPVVLPVPVALAGDVATLGDGGGLGEASPALVVADFEKDALAIGIRPVVTKGGALAPVKAGARLGEATPLAYTALAEVEADKDTGAIAGVSDRLAQVRDAIVSEPPEAVLPGERGVTLVTVAPGVPVAALTKGLDGLAAQGGGAVRVLRAGTGGAVLPLHVRTLPAELEASLVPGWEKSIVVVVGKDALDVWGPEGAKEGTSALGPEAAAALPASAQQGWRKDVLARLRVPLAPAPDPKVVVDVLPAPRIDATVLAAASDALEVFAIAGRGGRVVHVVAGEGATADEVLEVSRHFQEVGLEPAPELARVSEIWPGATCAKAAGCAGAVVVAFSKREPPSARGLSDKPNTKKEPTEPKEPKEPKPEPGPAPSAEFCNQADIKSNMAKKAGSFRFCYERELQLEKDLAGRVVMNFVIGLQGQVKSVRVASSELPNAKVGECIKKEIGKMQFKSPDGGECVVQWPFKFTAN